MSAPLVVQFVDLHGAHILVYCNSAVNPLLYALLNNHLSRQVAFKAVSAPQQALHSQQKMEEICRSPKKAGKDERAISDLSKSRTIWLPNFHLISRSSMFGIFSPIKWRQKVESRIRRLDLDSSGDEKGNKLGIELSCSIVDENSNTSLTIQYESPSSILCAIKYESSISFHIPMHTNFSVKDTQRVHMRIDKVLILAQVRVRLSVARHTYEKLDNLVRSTIYPDTFVEAFAAEGKKLRSRIRTVMQPWDAWDGHTRWTNISSTNRSTTHRLTENTLLDEFGP
uniref:Uncharacterized protein n=1 Tax=Romanomermis culicivorax TaxID=13658 RepID=A0A915K2Y6_ROMCU